MTVAGDLRQRIQLQERVSVENSRGEKTYDFATFYECWAQVNPKRGRQFFAAAQPQGVMPSVFRVRYRQGLDHTMRILWRGDYYDVTSPPVDVDGGTEWMDLYGTKGTGDGRKPPV